jgi:hypothetical protein
MAWNQPSGPNNQWGRRPGQGGPDLDERLKAWQRKLAALLRPSGKGTDGGRLIWLAVIVLAGLWLYTGLYQVKQAASWWQWRCLVSTGVRRSSRPSTR